MDVDLFAPATQEDWYPTYQYLSYDLPVYRIPGTDDYVITRYDDIMSVLRHQRTFPTGASKRRSEAAQAVYDRGGWQRMTPLGTNPPVQHHYRALVDHFFTGPGLDRWRTVIEAYIDEQFATFESDGRVEWNSQYAVPVPVRVISHLLGLPQADIAKLKNWSAAWILPFVRPLQPDEDVWVAEQLVEMYDYLAGQIETKRTEPGDDVITYLAWAGFAGDGEISGVPIPKGSTVHLRYGSGNRDERMFECPAEVRLDRPNSRRHLAFTLGEHQCPGADLGRLEQVLTLEAALRRLPDLRLADGQNDFSHVAMFTMRALRELHLEFTPAGR